MDFDMPIMDGFATTKALFDMRTQDELLVVPPIIGHSAYTSNEDKNKCLAAGMAAFLPKPCGKQEAMKLVEAFLLPKTGLW
jgi:CheY-like chemotaxis protein